MRARDEGEMTTKARRAARATRHPALFHLALIPRPRPAPRPHPSPLMTHPSPSPAPHAHPGYVGIFLVLALLTGLELGVAFLSWSKTVLIIILLVLAVWKAVLVALYYMHL